MTSNTQVHNIDLDNENECCNHSKVQTVKETHTPYKTFQPINVAIPKLSNPGDNNKNFKFKSDDAEAARLLILECLNIRANSNPDYSLLTFYSNDLNTLPPSHLSIQITPNIISSNKLQIIPQNFEIVYELLLDKNNFDDFTVSIQDFITWCKSRKSYYLITIPEQLEQQLQECVGENLLLETTRPFLKENYSYPHG